MRTWAGGQTPGLQYTCPDDLIELVFSGRLAFAPHTPHSNLQRSIIYHGTFSTPIMDCLADSELVLAQDDRLNACEILAWKLPSSLVFHKRVPVWSVRFDGQTEPNGFMRAFLIETALGISTPIHVDPAADAPAPDVSPGWDNLQHRWPSLEPSAASQLRRTPPGVSVAIPLPFSSRARRKTCRHLLGGV